MSRRCIQIAIAGLMLLSGHARAGEPAAPKFLLAWGKKGDKPGEFYSPIGVAINAKDEVFVTDLNNSRLQIFDNAGKHLGGFDLPRDQPKRRSCQAGGIVLDDAGLIYLTFMQQHRIGVYDRTGKLVREWGKFGKDDGEFNQPGGIVLASDNTVYVADQCNHRIQKFTTEGKFLAKWGAYGKKPGQFDGVGNQRSRFGGPHFLALARTGHLYTTEGIHGRVQKFDLDGKALLAFGDKGSQPGGFGALKTVYDKQTFGPIGVQVDSHGRVWVSSLNDRVQCFHADGKYLFGIAESGDGAGQLSRPHGMAFDSKGNLYIADAGNQRIQKFAVPRP